MLVRICRMLQSNRLLVATKRTNTNKSASSEASAPFSLPHSASSNNQRVASEVSTTTESAEESQSVTDIQQAHSACNTTKRSQDIQSFYQQQLHFFHSTVNHKQQQQQQQQQHIMPNEQVTGVDKGSNKSGPDAGETAGAEAAVPIKEPCTSSGPNEILQFMELIGNLKHTKRTGWVLRDVNDCESISGHMYRMSMLTFLLDGSEGLNQIRCMELALVHDLAESLVGDITPFCGVSKEQKRAMEFKAMEDICKLIEPRGKRIMALFEEYEHGESAESRFVKDLDRLDMVMQAFEYEKRDNCLLKHQEFFDSTEGKFQHPFVKKLVNAIYEQRKQLAQSRGATAPPAVHVPDMDALNSATSPSNDHTPPNANNTTNLS